MRRRCSAKNAGEIRGHCSAVTIVLRQSLLPSDHSLKNQPRLPAGELLAIKVPPDTANIGNVAYNSSSTIHAASSSTSKATLLSDRSETGLPGSARMRLPLARVRCKVDS